MGQLKEPTPLKVSEHQFQALPQLKGEKHQTDKPHPPWIAKSFHQGNRLLKKKTKQARSKIPCQSVEREHVQKELPPLDPPRVGSYDQQPQNPLACLPPTEFEDSQNTSSSK